MPFLATMPITMIMPMNEATLKVVCVIKQRQKDPEGGEQRRSKNGHGRGQGAELEQQHQKEQHQRQQQHQSEDRGTISAAPA